MSFKDPFADDLKNFGSPSRGLRGASTISFGNTSLGSPATSLGVGSPGFTPVTAASPLGGFPGPGRRRGVDGGDGTGLSLTTAVSDSILTTTSYPRSAADHTLPFSENAPISGRRRAAEGTPPLAPVSVNQTALSGGGLSWLDESTIINNNSNVLGGRRHGNNSIFGASSHLQSSANTTIFDGTTTVTDNGSSSADRLETEDEEDPLAFLDDNAGLTSEKQKKKKQQQEAQKMRAGAAQHHQQRSGAGTVIVHISPEEEQARREKAELYATLDALDMEIAAANEKLETRQLKEEAELTDLATTIIEKTLELTSKGAELDGDKSKIQMDTQRRLDDMNTRHEVEKQELVEDLTRVETVKYTRQLKQLTDAYVDICNSVRALQERRALLMQTRPYELDGITMALSVYEEKEERRKSTNHEDGSDAYSEDNDFESVDGATASASAQARGKGTSASSPAAVVKKLSAASPATDIQVVAPSGSGDGNSTTKDDEDASLAATARVEQEISSALGILRRYYEAHLDAIRDNVVDYIHDETIAAAHTVRTAREVGWSQDVITRKSRLHEHVKGMLSRHAIFVRDRDERMCQKRNDMRDRLRATGSQKHAAAQKRLEGLRQEVTVRCELKRRAFEETVVTSTQALERTVRATCEADAAISVAQRTEVERRHASEASARRQLFNMQQESLKEQLARLKNETEVQSSHEMQTLMAEAATSSSASVAPLKDQLREMKVAITAFTQSLACSSSPSSFSPFSATYPPGNASASCIESRMHVQEMNHTTQALLHTATETLKTLLHKKLRCRQLREEVHDVLAVEVAERLREKRAVQHAHQSKIDFVRLSWEKEHRQSLSSGLHLELPVVAAAAAFSSPHSPTLIPTDHIGVETHAAPGDVTLTALLECVERTLQTRDARHTALSTARMAHVAQYSKNVEVLRSHQPKMQTKWSGLLTRMLDLHVKQEKMMDEQMRVEREAGRAETEQMLLDEAKRDFLERRAELERQSAEQKAESESAVSAFEVQEATLRRLSEEQLNLARQQQQQQQQQEQQQLAMVAAAAAAAAAAGGGLSGGVRRGGGTVVLEGARPHAKEVMSRTAERGSDSSTPPQHSGGSVRLPQLPRDGEFHAHTSLAAAPSPLLSQPPRQTGGPLSTVVDPHQTPPRTPQLGSVPYHAGGRTSTSDKALPRRTSASAGARHSRSVSRSSGFDSGDKALHSGLMEENEEEANGYSDEANTPIPTPGRQQRFHGGKQGGGGGDDGSVVALMNTRTTRRISATVLPYDEGVSPVSGGRGVSRSPSHAQQGRGGGILASPHSSNAFDSSIVSATSAYQTNSFVDLLTLLDSTNTSSVMPGY